MARGGRKGVDVRTPLTNTVRTRYSTFPESFVPGWDKQAGAGQPMERAAVRRKMGAKMTPKGPGRTMRR